MASASDSLQSRHSSHSPLFAQRPALYPPKNARGAARDTQDASDHSKQGRFVRSPSGGRSADTRNSAKAQPPTTHGLSRHTSNSRERATLSSSSPVFESNTGGPTSPVVAPLIDTPITVPALPAGRPRGVGALYALANNDVGGSSRQVATDGRCGCVLCARVRREWSFGSDQSGWGWGNGARTGDYPVPPNCPIAEALDTVCAKRLAQFAATAAGVDNLPLYKLHVRRTVYLLAAAGAAALRALTPREDESLMPQSPTSRVQLRMPSFRRPSIITSSTRNSERCVYGGRSSPFADMNEPMWGLLNVRGDAWRPLTVSERMDIRAVVRSAKLFVERHAGPGSELAPDEFAALLAEVAATAPVPPVASWNRAPRWQSRALSTACRARMTPADSKLWANRMRDYLAFISDSTGVPIEVLRQLNAHCLDLAHMLAIMNESERSRSIRARSSSVSADSLRERRSTPPSRRASLRNHRSLSPIGSRLSFGSPRRSMSQEDTTMDNGRYTQGLHRNRRPNRWYPMRHTERTLLRIEMAQMYRYIHSFAVQDPCADYPDELAAILAEVYVTWPVPAGIDKGRHPRWSHRAVPEADWNMAGFRARQAYRLRSRKYLRFISDKTGVQPSYARKLDADSFDRLHASAIYHDIDTSAELYQSKLQPSNVMSDDPLVMAPPREDYGGWSSPVQSGSTQQRSSEAAELPLPMDEVVAQEEEYAEESRQTPRTEEGATTGQEEEEEEERGYEFNSLSDTAEGGENNPRPLTMSRRARMEHEVDEARWYLDCAKNAATSFASNLRDAAKSFDEGDSAEEENKAAGLPDRVETPSGSQHVRPTCAESVSSGESLREWLMRVECQEAQYSWECAACRGTGANPQRQTAPRWHWASLGVDVTETMDSKAREQWDAHANEYLRQVAKLVGVAEAKLRAASAEQFERWHVEALRAYAAEHGEMPPDGFAPTGDREGPACRGMPHTRAFISRILGVSEASMRRLSDDECAGLLSVVVFDGMAPFGIDRQSYPPWHHRSVPAKEWSTMAEAQRRERRMHFRKEILAIARRYSVPPLVVTELDARTYRLVSDGTREVTNGAVAEVDTKVEGVVDSAPLCERRHVELAEPLEKDEKVEAPAVDEEEEEVEEPPVEEEQDVEVPLREDVAPLSEEQNEDVQEGETTAELIEQEVGAQDNEFSQTNVQPVANMQEVGSSGTLSQRDTSSGTYSQNVLSSRTSSVPEEPPPADEATTEAPAANPPPQRVVVPLQAAPPPSLEDAVDRPPTPEHTETPEDEVEAPEQREPQKRAVRFEDAEEEEECSSEVLTPVVNITRAEGATTEMYRRSLLQFARQMTGEDGALERMSTAELADIVRNAVSTAFRRDGANPSLLDLLGQQRRDD